MTRPTRPPVKSAFAGKSGATPPAPPIEENEENEPEAQFSFKVPARDAERFRAAVHRGALGRAGFLNQRDFFARVMMSHVTEWEERFNDGEPFTPIAR